MDTSKRDDDGKNWDKLYLTRLFSAIIEKYFHFNIYKLQVEITNYLN